MTRGQTYFLIATIGIAGLAVLGALNTERVDHEIRAYNWPDQIQAQGGSLIVNAVRVVRPFDAGERRFSYYTGAYAPGSGEPSAVPTKVIAESSDGAVTVRLLAFDPYVHESAEADAAETARMVSLTTARVWPAESTPVRVDVHFMPRGSGIAHAMQVDWREGDAYALAVFEREGEFSPHIAVHELYHVLAGRWSLGKHDAANGARSRAADAYEEVAADLFAECGRLLANGSLSRETSGPSFTINGRRFEGELDPEELAGALDLLSQVALAHVLRGLLARTILADAFGEESTIALESPQGGRLLARCREAAANPMLLSFRFAELLKTSAATDERRALDD